MENRFFSYSIFFALKQVIFWSRKHTRLRYLLDSDLWYYQFWITLSLTAKHWFQLLTLKKFFQLYHMPRQCPVCARIIQRTLGPDQQTNTKYWDKLVRENNRFLFSTEQLPRYHREVTITPPYNCCTAKGYIFWLDTMSST